MLHVDIPTLAEMKALHRARADACVSIYVSTTPHTQHVKASRIAFSNLAKAASSQLEAAAFDKRRRARLEIDRRRAYIARRHFCTRLWMILRGNRRP